jgi:hypothetical protein
MTGKTRPDLENPYVRGTTRGLVDRESGDYCGSLTPQCLASPPPGFDVYPRLMISPS